MAKLFHSLRTKFILGLALFVSGVLLTVMFLLEQDIRASLIRENIDKGIGVASAIALNAEDPLLTGDDIALVSAVKNALRAPGIGYAAIVDRKGVVRAANDLQLVAKPYALSPGAQTIEEGNGYRVSRFTTGSGSILDLEVPIVSLAGEHITLGAIHLGLSEEIITRAIAAMRHKLQALSIVVLFLGSAVAYFVATLSVRPVNALVAGVTAVGNGDLTQHIDLKRQDELGVLTEAFNTMTASLREKEFIKNTFERYVSKELAEQILQHKDQLRLGGEERDVTILFCDLRGFTTLAEGLTPPQVVEFLNEFFTELVAIIERHDGMVDKFIGDAVMALFGAPVPITDPAGKAVRSAADIKDAVVRINRKLAAAGRPTISVGIGINSGPVILGNIGSSNRMEYTAIGDHVNLASRLESLNKAYGTMVLLSESTRRAVNDPALPFRELDAVLVLGKKQPVTIYEPSTDEALRTAYRNPLTLYRQGDFAAAAAAFEELVRRYDDQPARVLAQRCRHYQAAPPANWQGIFPADSK